METAEQTSYRAGCEACGWLGSNCDTEDDAAEQKQAHIRTARDETDCATGEPTVILNYAPQNWDELREEWREMYEEEIEWPDNSGFRDSFYFLQEILGCRDYIDVQRTPNDVMHITCHIKNAPDDVTHASVRHFVMDLAVRKYDGMAVLDVNETSNKSVLKVINQEYLQ